MGSDTICRLLEVATAKLTSSYTPRLDAEILLCHVLRVDLAYLISHADSVVTKQAIDAFWQLLEQRRNAYPVAYLTMSKEFWSLPLTVSSAVLIPRPETELLVEKALLFAQKNAREILNILDMGTGSGAIALALASELPQAKITAIDNSMAALDVAKSNAQKLNLTRVEFIQSNWFDQLAGHQFDIICANPPYIDADDPHLSRGDVRFEPRCALVAANNGLANIQYIAQQAQRFLSLNGVLFFEHGFNQASSTRQALSQFGYKEINTYNDLNQQPRVTSGHAATTSYG